MNVQTRIGNGMNHSSTRRALSVLGLTAMAACQSPTVPALMREEPAHARGTVTEREEAADGLRFLMEDRPGTDTGDKFYVTIDARTGIFHTTSAGDTVVAEERDIAVQSPVSVWFEGPILESYPAQAVARYILVQP